MSERHQRISTTEYDGRVCTAAAAAAVVGQYASIAVSYHVCQHGVVGKEVVQVSMENMVSR